MLYLTFFFICSCLVGYFLWTRRVVLSSVCAACYTIVSVVSHSVPPFDVNVSLEVDAVCTLNLLQTPLLTPIPVGQMFVGVPNDAAVFSHSAVDNDLAHCIYGFMNAQCGEGEEGLISRNDCFCNIFKTLASMEKFSRNKHEDSTQFTTRADRTDKYEGVSLVITEEKILSLADAKNDLLRKVRWIPHYSKLPFVFAVAIAGNQLEVYAIKSNTELKSLFRADMNSIPQRWSCIVVAINMARIIKSFIERNLIIPSKLRFDMWHERNNKKIRLELNCATVQFPTDAVFVKMVAFYDAANGVPNLEQMFDNDRGKRRIKLTPVGVNRKPDSIDELVSSVKNICLCLFELHLKKYFHCDVRWGNIICLWSQWYLIDCEFATSHDDAATLATRSSTTIKTIYVKDPTKPWDATFDLYQVGMLLADDDVKDMVSTNTNLVSLCELLRSKEFTVAMIKTLVSRL